MQDRLDHGDLGAELWDTHKALGLSANLSGAWGHSPSPSPFGQPILYSVILCVKLFDT